MLRFQKPNAKLEKLAASRGVKIATFSLPAGWTCPGAVECLSKADRQTGKITDGPETVFRCFAASMERYASVRDSRWENLDAVKAALRRGGPAAAAEALLAALPEDVGLVRVHVSGDFFSADYFLAWCIVARERPDTVFYAYTKSVKTWQDNHASLPSNLVLTASVGGKHDELIEALELRRATVVYSEAEAEQSGWSIDHDDGLASDPEAGDFALLIHGMQPPGSKASKAVTALRKAGEFGYGKAADRRRELATV